MRRVLVALAFVLSAQLACMRARAADYYVAADGSDSNPGSMAQPFASIERAQMAAAAGDTVFIRGGVYRFSGTSETVGVSFTKSGQSGKPIRYFAFAGELPIFDLFELKPQQRVTGLDVRCNWIHIRGLELRGVRQIVVGDSWGVRIRGDHNVIEQLNVHDCEAPGIFITSGASNLILNCDSHHNYDPLEEGGNADGFGCHSNGGDNVLRGCRAYENSDDGFDFINAPGTCIAEQSWAFRNGYIPDTQMTGANGAGFKSGGFGYPPMTPASGAPRHVIRQNLAFGNRSIGFYANFHPGGIDFLNNTAFDNPANYDMRTPGEMSSHKLRNNVALMPGRDIINFNGGTDTNNSWTLSVEVSDADFVSVDQAIGLMPRQADGSLPDMGFARLASGSDLIDRGEDVGLAHTGSAADLGAYEFGETQKPVLDAGMPDAGAPDAGAVGTKPRQPVMRMDAAVTLPAAGGARSVPPPSAASVAGAMAIMQQSSAGATAAAAGSGVSGAATPVLAREGCGCRVTATRRMPALCWAMLALGVLARLGRKSRRRAAARTL